MDRLEGGGRLNRKAALHRCTAVQVRGEGMWRWKGNPGPRCRMRVMTKWEMYARKKCNK